MDEGGDDRRSSRIYEYYLLYSRWKKLVAANPGAADAASKAASSAAEGRKPREK